MNESRTENREEKPGMVHVYTGGGKGKTTAAIGITIRALGAGLRVFFAQFIKGRRYSELEILEDMEGLELRQYGQQGFIRGKPEAEDIELARRGLKETAKALKSGKYGLVVLDEATIALKYELFTLDELLEVLAGRARGVEAVVTGGGAPPELIESADLVTSMEKIKHYFDEGVAARAGIEK